MARIVTGHVVLDIDLIHRSGDLDEKRVLRSRRIHIAAKRRGAVTTDRDLASARQGDRDRLAVIEGIDRDLAVHVDVVHAERDIGHVVRELQFDLGVVVGIVAFQREGRFLIGGAQRSCIDTRHIARRVFVFNLRMGGFLRGREGDIHGASVLGKARHIAFVGKIGTGVPLEHFAPARAQVAHAGFAVAPDQVVARAALDIVVAGARVDLVEPRACLDDIIAVEAIDDVVVAEFARQLGVVVVDLVAVRVTVVVEVDQIRIIGALDNAVETRGFGDRVETHVGDLDPAAVVV